MKCHDCNESYEHSMFKNHVCYEGQTRYFIENNDSKRFVIVGRNLGELHRILYSMNVQGKISILATEVVKGDDQ